MHARVVSNICDIVSALKKYHIIIILYYHLCRTTKTNEEQIN